MTFWRYFLWLNAVVWLVNSTAWLFIDVPTDRRIQASIMAAVFTVGAVLAEMIRKKDRP